jgi:hypothetical protein
VRKAADEVDEAGHVVRRVDRCGGRGASQGLWRGANGSSTRRVAQHVTDFFPFTRVPDLPACDLCFAFA